MEFNSLPEDCLSYVISLTSPRDACRLALVSSFFKLASQSDTVWEKFLPSDFLQILSRSVFSIPFSSKKQLYFNLCNPVLLDGGKKIFKLEKSTSRKCYTLLARELSITWGSNPLYWTWKCPPHSQSRFSEVAELRTIWWLEIQGKIAASMLSPKTTYAAYLIVKFADRAYGLDTLPSETSIQTSSYQWRGTAYLRFGDEQKRSLEQLYFSNRIQVLRSRVGKEEEHVPRERSDGWMEVELGEFFNSGVEGDVKMGLKEVKGHHLKGGLIVQGIEIRPKFSSSIVSCTNSWK
ncbi:F-box protein PP2-B15-like [Macadamia integrifolia]|uniref:F-box protein PP2-B15-like n=1 Tax=Macadamia integrifolia TaxID=60698 RepID=UPI001C527958|nr:F-box protein PP2-B15-like [Macadamia integrifolia]